MRSLRAIVSGTLVSAQETPYEAFKDRDGNERPSGVTRHLYVVPKEGGEPIAVKVEKDQTELFELLEGAVGDPVDLVVVATAYNSNVRARLAEIVR